MSPRRDFCLRYCSWVAEAEKPAARLKLNGDRFSGGHLPVDVLIEVQRYQTLAITAARNAWRQENPGQELPEGFDDAFKFTIVQIEDGSATLLLERPALTEYEASFESGIAQFEELLSNALNTDVARYEGSMPAEVDYARDLPLVELASFREFGSSLTAGEEITFPDATAPIELTVESRAARLVPFVEYVDELTHPRTVGPRRRTVQGSIAGRLTAINADQHNFKVDTLAYGTVSGRYKSVDLLEDLKAVLDTRDEAQVCRLEGMLRFNGERLERILNLEAVEVFGLAESAWSDQLLRLAALPYRWTGEGAGELISFSALDAAGIFLSAAQEIGLPTPGIFPLEDGGVQLEWSSPDRVSTLEIPASLFYATFDLVVETGAAIENATTRTAEVIVFLQGLAS